MTIDFNKQGLRLGYLIRGEYRDRNGVRRYLRLCGPATQLGTGFVAPDPDDTGKWPDTRFWRAGVFEVSLVDDAGKLSQGTGTPSTLDLTIGIGYPAEPDVEVSPGDSDETLREHLVSGRWWMKEVELWLVDVETGDTEHRFSGQWSRDPNSRPGATQIQARERAGPLQRSWRMTTIPADPASVFTATGLSNSALIAITPVTVAVPDSLKNKLVGCVFGYNSAAATNTTPAPVFREVVYYGRVTTVDRSVFFHISPQFGCGCSVIRFVGDDGTIYESASVLVGHNYYPDHGPLGTFAKIVLTTAQYANFNPEDNDNRAFARIHGPADDPTLVEWHPLYREPYTLLSGGGAATPSIMHPGEVLEEVVSKPEFLNEPNLLGTGAVSAFISGTPAGSANFPDVLAAVPKDIEDEAPTYDAVLTALFQGIGADLMKRRDPASGERRLFPLWRRPQSSTEPADHVLRPSDYVSSQPPSVQQLLDPRGEYGNDVSVRAPDFYTTLPTLPIASEDQLQIVRTYGQRVQNLVEQSAPRLGTPVATKRQWDFWSPFSARTGAEQSRNLAAEASQRQVWTVAEVGKIGWRIQLGDTIQHGVHGITRAVGQVRRLEYSLDSQTVEVTACHLVFYDQREVGGEDEE